jgi:hypothetical protein
MKPAVVHPCRCRSQGRVQTKRMRCCGDCSASNWVGLIVIDAPSAAIDLEDGRELKRVEPCVLAAEAANSR